MKVCIPTADDAGLDAVSHGHFGSAPFFTLVDTETGQVEVLTNSDSAHEHGTCQPVGGLESMHLDAVICRGMGRRALANLRNAGIRVFVTDRETVSEMITATRMGEAKALSGPEACQGHGHVHENEPCP